jgi:hypothetical protein
MLIVKGKVKQGCGHFRQRMTNFPLPFRKATGEDLFKGTLNVELENNRCIPITEQFRIRGTDIAEPWQDLLFEVCRISGLWAYRIRPYDLCTGAGGHGDNILEIACSEEIPNVSTGSQVQIELFRDEVEPIEK